MWFVRVLYKELQISIISSVFPMFHGMFYTTPARWGISRTRLFGTSQTPMCWWSPRKTRCSDSDAAVDVSSHGLVSPH